MKKIIIAIIVLIALGAGYVVFMKKPVQPAPHTQTSVDRLNMNVVCQSALAYMTFPDAASADVFVADCKEGKHPEVIERYKAEMNLGDGTAI